MDATTKLPVMETIKIAWSKVKGAKMTFFAVMVVYAILEAVNEGVNRFLNMHQGSSDATVTDAAGNAVSSTSSLPMSLLIVAAIFMITIVVIQYLLTFGMTYLGIRRAADLPIAFKMVGHVFNWRCIFRLIGLNICFVILMLLAIIPMGILSLAHFVMAGMGLIVLGYVCQVASVLLAIFIVMRLYLSLAICIFEDAGPIDSIRRSFAATKGNVTRLFGLTVLTILIFIVSIIPFGIGLIWGMPFIYTNYGCVYKMLITDKRALQK